MTAETGYQDEHVTITSEGVTIDGHTYPREDILDVRKTFTVPNRAGCALLVILLALHLVAAGLAIWHVHFVLGAPFLLLGIFLLVGGLDRLTQPSTPQFHLVLTTPTGKARLLRTEDERYIDRLVASIQEAGGPS